MVCTAPLHLAAASESCDAAQLTSSLTGPFAACSVLARSKPPSAAPCGDMDINGKGNEGQLDDMRADWRHGEAPLLLRGALPALRSAGHLGRHPCSQQSQARPGTAAV